MVTKFVAPAKATAAGGSHSSEGPTPTAAVSGVAGLPTPFAGATLSFILAFAALWTLTEWLRSWVFTGFAWNPLSAFLVPIHLAGPTALIGTYGVSALALLWIGWGLLLAPKWAAMFRGGSRDGTILSAIMLGPVLLFGFPVLFMSLQSWGEADYLAARAPAIPITVVQPNVGQADKWVGAKADANFAKLARLTATKNDIPRLILWPEAAVPDYLEAGYPAPYYDRSPAAARARLIDLMNPDDLMLLGALKLELDKTGEVIGARNAVMTIHADGTLGPRYDKAHLVPYGEYLPLRPVLSAIGLSRLAPGDIDFWPGPGARTLTLPEVVAKPMAPNATKAELLVQKYYSRPTVKVGLQICYEIIFSGQVVDRAHRPDFIFNPSNDAWFGGWGPPQHLAQARLRAIEEGLPVVRATPTGISAVIDADGRVLKSLPMHVAGRIDTFIPPAHAPTLFVPRRVQGFVDPESGEPRLATTAGVNSRPHKASFISDSPRPNSKKAPPCATASFSPPKACPKDIPTRWPTRSAIRSSTCSCRRIPRRGSPAKR